jgi:hypothetical protein
MKLTELRSRIPRPSPAMVVALIALFVALGGTALAATYVVSSNSQIGPGTVSGHAGTATNKNIISGSVNATDLANQAVTAATLKAPEAWHEVAAGTTGSNACSNVNTTGVFCSSFTGDLGYVPWKNFGGGNATAAFYKDQLGIIHLKGLVVPPTDDLTRDTPERRSIFRLPTGYRPQSTRVFPSVGQASYGQEVAQGRVDVQSDGLVVLEKDCVTTSSGCSANIGYLTIDGITFRPTG